MTIASAIATAATTLYYGPFVFAPLVAVAITMATVHQTDRRNRRFALAAHLLGLVVPSVLSLLRLHPVDLDSVGDALVMRPFTVAFPREATILNLTFGYVAVTVLAAIFASRYRDRLSDLALQNRLQRWQLEQLVPRDARDALGES